MGGRHGRRRNTTPVGGVDGQHYSPFTCTHMALVDMALVEASLGVLLFIDFIIIHPRMGVLFLECKGGLLEYDRNKRKWISSFR